MAWTNIPTFTVGQVLTSSTMNYMRSNANIGHLICTSASRPVSADTGSMIYETDTNRALVWNGTAWTYISILVVTSTTRPASVPTGTCLYETDTGYSRVYDGTLWRHTGPIPSVNAFPSSPVDGDEVVFNANLTNGVRWHFKYRFPPGLSQPWEFIGGPPMCAAWDGGYGTSEIGPTSTYVQTLSGSPSIIAPLAGEYRASVTAVSKSSNGTAAPGLWISFGGATCPNWNSSDSISSGTASGSAHPLAANKSGFVSLSGVIALNWTNANTGGTASFFNVRLEILPIRCSG